MRYMPASVRKKQAENTKMTLDSIERCELLRRLERAEQRQKSIAALLMASLVGTVLLTTRTPAISQTSTQLQAEIAALQATLQFVTTNGTTMTISGANLVVNNGAGKTATANGLGNISVGYNELGNTNSGGDVRTGSHNLVLGSANSFSSYGGIVAGSDNTISGTFACVEGGFGNVSSGAFANIGGGYQNVANANSTYIGGGGQNTASGPGASITGGNSNIASGGSSAISGGYSNVASGSSTYVGGGEVNTAAGAASSISGGYSNKTVAAASAISGGVNNTANGNSSVVLGGNGNNAVANYSVVPLDAAVASITAINTTVTGLSSTVTALGTTVSGMQTALTTDTTAITSLQTTATSNTTAIAAVQAQTKYITSGTDANGFPATFISNCNVWVQSGSGMTDDGVTAGTGTLTGLGNLILGYNETGNFAGDSRIGSHNLILGAENNYSSFGGAVFGLSNAISAAFATVTAGESNQASGYGAAITGGSGSVASGDYASISGGLSNLADGNNATVSGGVQNSADSLASTISGGYLNVAAGQASTVAGGASNQATGDYSSILGGYLNWVLTIPPAQTYPHMALFSAVGA